MWNIAWPTMRMHQQPSRIVVARSDGFTAMPNNLTLMSKTSSSLVIRLEGTFP